MPAAVSGCQKSPRTFPTACKNAVTFPPLRGGKVLAALAERLAVQGIRGIRSHSRRAAAPSSSPANTRADSSEQRFFDKLRQPPATLAAVFLSLFVFPALRHRQLVTAVVIGIAGVARVVTSSVSLAPPCPAGLALSAAPPFPFAPAALGCKWGPFCGSRATSST